jgi:hypothetical protein
MMNGKEFHMTYANGAEYAGELHVSACQSYMPIVAEWLRRAYPALPERAGVGLIPANSDAQNVPSFRRLAI